MDLNAVMDEIGAALDTIGGLAVYDWPTDEVEPPAAVVELPEVIDLAESRSIDEFELAVVVYVGAAAERTARRRLAEYATGAGARSVRHVLQSYAYRSCDAVRVQQIEMGPSPPPGTAMLVGRWSLLVIGTGKE